MVRRPLQGGGLEDQVSRRAGVGDGDRVRRAGDLDRAASVGALGHVVLELLGDVAVLLAEDEPGGNVLPQRALAGRLDERLLRDRPLRGGHPRGLRRRHVGAELLVEALLDDRQVGRAVAARDGLQRVAERAAGEDRRQLEAALAGQRGERGDVDEPDDLAGVGVDVRHDGAAVRVGDEDDRALDRADHVTDGSGVGGEAAQRIGDGGHGIPRVEQRIDDLIPARGLGEGAVDEDDGGAHRRSFRGRQSVCRA